MSDSNPSSHWDSLASSLGAVPSNSEEALRQPAARPEKPAAPKKAKPAHRPASSAKPAAWDQLAEQFGLSSTPSEPHPTGLSVSTPSPVAPAPSAETTDRPTPPPDTPEESPNFFDERFDFEEPFDLLESSEGAAAPVEAVVEKEETSEKRSRRRRRRRRRPSDRRDAEATPPQQSKDEREPSPTEVELEGIAQEVGAEAEAVEESSRHCEEGESGERRSKRRRPRRGGRKRRRSPEGEGDENHAEAAVAAEPVESIHDDDLDLHEATHEFEEGDDQNDADEPARAGFRGIPKWEEVVGMIIDKNIEGRAKRAAANPHHGRNNNRGGKRRS